MFNETCVVKVTKYSGSTSQDKNSEETLMLQILAGNAPNRNVIAGTVAKRSGFEEGKVYLAQVRETGYHEVHGRQFNWLAVQELTGTEIVDAMEKLGSANLEVIDKPQSDYKRITNAVESQRTRDIKDGLFKPAINSGSANHENAELVDGASLNSEAAKRTNQAVKSLKKTTFAGAEVE